MSQFFPAGSLSCASLLFLVNLAAEPAADFAAKKPEAKKARVVLVSSGNTPMDAFLSDNVAGKFATVTRLKPTDLKHGEKYLKPAGNGAFDLVIFDGCAPEKEEHLPKSNTLFVGHPPPPWKLGDMTRVANPSVKSWAKKHPLLQNLNDLDKIGIAECYQFKELPKGAERLIEGDKETVLLMNLPRKPYLDLFLAFRLMKEGDKEEWNTNWPLRPDFPLFLANVIHILGNVDDASK